MRADGCATLVHGRRRRHAVIADRDRHQRHVPLSRGKRRQPVTRTKSLAPSWAGPGLSRRAVLRGAAGAALALPLLNDLSARQARAASASFPKRLFVYFTPNGTVPSAFFGPGNPNTLQLGGIL